MGAGKGRELVGGEEGWQAREGKGPAPVRLVPVSRPGSLPFQGLKTSPPHPRDLLRLHSACFAACNMHRLRQVFSFSKARKIHFSTQKKTEFLT